MRYTFGAGIWKTAEAIMIVPVDHYVKVGSIQTRYWSDGEGSPVVLIHGLGGSATGWLNTFGPLCAEHRVYALDLIGHGRTDRLTGAQHKFSDLADFVCEFMSTLEIDRAHEMGHSMGGAVALQFVTAYPARVQKLLLADSGGLGREAASFLRLMSIPALGELICKMTYTTDVKKFARQVRASAFDASNISDELIENVYQVEQGPDQYKTTLKVLRMGADWMGQKAGFYKPILEQLPTIMSPTLLIWGGRDALVPVEHGERAVKLLPNARLEVIENCGHTPMFEQPAVFNRLVREFLRDQEILRN
jgi:4,5:9,10-diseco-3-hydroxy-5,9,17-trioxoandrosta-1(10),2-diene-4-oate hydrolase